MEVKDGGMLLLVQSVSQRYGVFADADGFVRVGAIRG